MRTAFFISCISGLSLTITNFALRWTDKNEGMYFT